jgi:cysteinyl-tRNA synthetase
MLHRRRDVPALVPRHTFAGRWPKNEQVTLDDLKARGHQPAAVRYVLLSGHYRQPLNFTLEQVAGAKSALEKLAKFEAEIAHHAGRPAAPMLAAPFQPAWDALLDDLNTPKALGQLFSTLNELDAATLPAATAGEVLDGLHFIVEAMGLTLPEIEDELPIEVPPDVRELAEKRWQARLARDWATSDELRRQLAARGWSVKDGRESYEMSRDA